MPRKKTNSAAMRQIAEDIIERLAGEVLLPESERGDYVTSLVRQWLTYDGCATFIVGEERQVYLVLDRTPLGKQRVRKEWKRCIWFEMLYRDWKINADDVPELIDQLNRGQSADVINTNGVSLRLWVNPKDRRQGVEPADLEALLKGMPTKPNYPRIAANILPGQIREGLDAGEMAQLAASVAKQWQQFDGNACIFLDASRAHSIRIGPKGDATLDVHGHREKIDLVHHLARYGFAAEQVPEIIARVNLAEPFKFRGHDGTRFQLWHDPKAKRFWVQPLDSNRRRQPPVGPPVFCSKCAAVLACWKDGESQQTCRFCSNVVSRS